MPPLESNATPFRLIFQSGTVAEAERRLSVVKELVQRATRLRQLILQKSFTEKL